MDNTAQNPLSNITQPLSASRSFFQKNLSKIIFGLLGLVVVIELIYGARTLLSPSRGRTAIVNAKIQSISDPKIIVSPSLDQVGVGQSVDVNIRVVTGGKSTDSTDLVLKFDPKFLETSATSIKLGQIYSEYPVADVDQFNGLVAVSGITLPNRVGFTGIGTFATVTFKAKQAGKTTISVDYQKGATADSNVVESGTAKDILSEVVNADITIGGTSETKNFSENSCPGYTQYCFTADGKTGRQFCKQGKKVRESCLFDPNLTVSCDVCKVEK